ncbi:TIGR02253 family HAD-type hydrolase [Candidatus Micrarchaeota archaeon]|nr:TIGR02253 family HAD-type hydrolase [Candidatus Micrarchaeota archaeon]
MVKYLLFDIDDTLFPSGEFSALARKNALNAMIGMGLECDYGRASEMLLAIIEKKGPNYAGHFNDLCKQLGIAEPGRYIAAAVAAYHDTKTSIAPFPKVPPALLRLREGGYRLYIATQGISIKQWDKLIRLRIALYFEGVFVSEELKEDKGPAFYRKVLKSLDARPEDCMMVGDREDTDILPAKAVGMKAVRILYGKQAKRPTKADFAIKDISELVPILQSL